MLPPGSPKEGATSVSINIGDYALKYIDKQSGVYNPPFPYAALEHQNRIVCAMGNGSALVLSNKMNPLFYSPLHELGIVDMCISSGMPSLLYTIDNIGRINISTVGESSIDVVHKINGTLKVYDYTA
jgi:hypothetical protein